MKRGRNQRRRPGANPNRALDSNGPDVRIRGTANQIYDKYQALVRDAHSAGDRVKAESYLQHAEHYFRLIRSLQPAQPPASQQGQESDADQPGVDDNSEQRENGQRENDSRDRSAPIRRGRNNHSRNDAGAEPSETTAEAKPEEKTQTVAAEEPAPVEEKKPRRKRAPRRTVKSADSGDTESKPAKPTPAAAE